MIASRIVTVLAVTIMFLSWGQGASASPWYGAQFSADILMTHPKDASKKGQGKLYVGKSRVRAEGQLGDASRAVILDPFTKKVWTLIPDKKAYYEGRPQMLPPVLPRWCCPPMPSTPVRLP